MSARHIIVSVILLAAFACGPISDLPFGEETPGPAADAGAHKPDAAPSGADSEAEDDAGSAVGSMDAGAIAGSLDAAGPPTAEPPCGLDGGGAGDAGVSDAAGDALPFWPSDAGDAASDAAENDAEAAVFVLIDATADAGDASTVSADGGGEAGADVALCPL